MGNTNCAGKAWEYSGANNSRVPVLGSLIWHIENRQSCADSRATSSTGLVLWQAMVPLWDALNHVTGKANVRMKHSEDTGALQMICTQPISAGSEV